MTARILSSRYLRMAENNRWSNYRLLGACAKLDHVEWEAVRTGFFPSLPATLNHVLIVDWYYVDALRQGNLGLQAFSDEVPCRRVTALAQAQFTVDMQLIDFCSHLNDSALDDAVLLQRRAGVQQERVEDILLHLFAHQSHHRGQAHAMLSGTSVKPPQLDEFYCAMDAPLRREELSRLHTDPY